MPLRIVHNGVVTRSVRDTAAFYREMERVAANPKLPPIGDITGPGKPRLRIAVCTQSIARKASPEVSELTFKTVRAARGTRSPRDGDRQPGAGPVHG